MKKDPNRKMKIIGFIANYSQKYGKAPTMREIMKGVGLHSLSGIYQHLNELGFTLGNYQFWKDNKKELSNKMACPTCLRPFNSVLIPVRGKIVDDKKLGNKIVACG